MVWLIESGIVRKRHRDVKNTQLGDKEETRVAWMIQSAVFAWVHFLSERERERERESTGMAVCFELSAGKHSDGGRESRLC